MSVFSKDRDFWRDEESVVVPSQPPVAVYTNNFDVVIVRQCDGDDDVFVQIRPENVPAVVRALLMEVGLEGLLVRGFPHGPYLADPREGELVEDGAERREAPATPRKDPTAAERQRRYRAAHRNGQIVTRNAPERDVTDLLAIDYREAA